MVILDSYFFSPAERERRIFVSFNFDCGFLYKDLEECVGVSFLLPPSFLFWNEKRKWEGGWGAMGAIFLILFLLLMLLFSEEGLGNEATR